MSLLRQAITIGFLLLAAGAALLFCAVAGAQPGNPATGAADVQPMVFHGEHKTPANTPTMDAGDIEAHVGVDERLGALLDRQLAFRDEDGQPVVLENLIARPAIILPVYFYCPQACSTMLANLAQALNDVPLVPGEEYQVIAVSFDAHETPAIARQAKANYLKILKPGFPPEQWKFLTGEASQVAALMDGLGYRFKRTGPHLFVHPNALVVASAEGKIIRYVYGLRFLPFDIGMALTEATKGTPQVSIRRLLTYCFDYDPGSKRYVFNFFRVVGGGIILALAVLLLFLLRKGKPAGRKRPSRQGIEDHE